MLGRNTLLAISTALQASAFLLPPGTTATTAKALSFPANLDTKSRLLPVPCLSCSLDSAKTESEDEELFWIQDTRRHAAVDVLLNFTISEDGKALLLNNEQIYPISYDVEDLLKPDWYVQQVDANVNAAELASGNYESSAARITGHMLGQADTKMAAPQGDELVSITWQLLSLDHKVADVNEILIQMIHTEDDELLLLAVDESPDSIMSSLLFPAPLLKPVEIDLSKSAPLPFHFGKPHDRPAPHKNCKNLPGPLCSIVDFVDNKVNSLKPKPCGGRPKFDSFDGRLPTHNRPHFGQHGKFGPRPHHHGMFHNVSKAILAVLLPAMAGIIVGLVVSVLGLMTGHFVGWLWFTVIRGGKKGAYTRVAADDIVIVVTDADKKDVFVEEEIETLPLYEDAPAYEEKEAL